jgi:hypothetical protein
LLARALKGRFLMPNFLHRRRVFKGPLNVWLAADENSNKTLLLQRMIMRSVTRDDKYNQLHSNTKCQIKRCLSELLVVYPMQHSAVKKCK